MLKPFLAALALTGAAAPDHPVKIIPGAIPADRQPDGNTVVFEDEDGLIVVDTGRHFEHQGAILAYAYERKKPIAAIVNTHWHLDHSGGNAELRALYPNARIYTSNAVTEALDGFLAKGLANGRARLDDPHLPETTKAETRLGVAAIENRRDLIPDVPVIGDMKLGRLDLYLAPYAATAGDVWLYDPDSATLVAGDLVVVPVPFFDTACAQGWKKALDRIATQPFERLVPGHGPALTRAQFATYRAAFGRLVDCAASTAAAQACIDGWQKDAADFITSDAERAYTQEALVYYIDEVIRAPGKQDELCGRKGG